MHFLDAWTALSPAGLLRFALPLACLLIAVFLPGRIAAPGNNPVDIIVSRRSTRSKISPWLWNPWPASSSPTISASASRLVRALRCRETALGLRSSESLMGACLRGSKVRRDKTLKPIGGPDRGQGLSPRRVT